MLAPYGISTVALGVMRKEKNMISNCHIHSDIDSDCLLCLKDHDEVDVITDHLPEPKCGMDKLVESLREEKCCSICESSEDGCGANDLSEAEYWEMKADIYNGL